MMNLTEAMSFVARNKLTIMTKKGERGVWCRLSQMIDGNLMVLGGTEVTQGASILMAVNRWKRIFGDNND